MESTADSTRRTSFSDQIDIHIVEDLTLHYKADLWFDGDEIASFTHEAAIEVRNLPPADGMTLSEYAAHNEQETHSFLGLEGFLTPEVRREIKHRRAALYRTVMLTQRLQESLGTHNSDAIAYLCQANTVWAAKRAREIGMLHRSG